MSQHIERHPSFWLAATLDQNEVPLQEIERFHKKAHVIMRGPGSLVRLEAIVVLKDGWASYLRWDVQQRPLRNGDIEITKGANWLHARPLGQRW